MQCHSNIWAETVFTGIVNDTNEPLRMCVHFNGCFIRSEIKSNPPFKTNIPQGNFSELNVTYLNHMIFYSLCFAGVFR